MNEDSNIQASENNPFTHQQLPLGVRLFLNTARIVFRVTGWVSPRLAGVLALRALHDTTQVSDTAPGDAGSRKRQPDQA
ncbi:MAG: hypothetical protein ABW087_13555 [Candidatus Thiodiazotropha sp.]